jgi:S-adenosylmethionine synthetase
MTRKFSEYVSPGHPDKVADYISEYILDRYLEKDPNVRYAVEVMIKGNMVHLAGEITSTAYFEYIEYKEFVKQALREIGYTEEYYKTWGGNVVSPEEIELQVDITSQSSEISQGVDNDGWGDQGIFFGYADPDEEYMAPRSHSLAKDLCHMLYTQARNEGIGGVDIKTEIILDEDGRIEKIIAAVPCRNDAEHEAVMNSIEDWLEKWYETVPADSKPNTLYSPEVILNGTGNYVMHGPVADCGITGRKLVVDFYGGELHVGGGSPWTKDGSKADLTLNLYARELARKYAKEENVPVKVSIACCIGRSDVDYVVETMCGEEITHGWTSITPRELIEKYGLDKPIFASMCTFGLFGKYQKDKVWEKR